VKNVNVPVAVFFEVMSHLWFVTLGVVTIVAPVIEELAKANSLFYRYEKGGKSLVHLGLLSSLGFGIAEFFVHIHSGLAFLVRLPAIGFRVTMPSIIGYGI
jgi:hypothetical protein